MAFSCVRIGMADAPERLTDTEPASAPANGAAAPAPLARREAIVYSNGDDATYYHLCGHTPQGATREALPVSLAKQRGLVPCPTCFSKQ